MSLDWLLLGSLKGLQRMVHDRKIAGAKATSPRQRAIDFIELKCGQLTPEKRRIVEEEISRMLDEREPA